MTRIIPRTKSPITAKLPHTDGFLFKQKRRAQGNTGQSAQKAESVEFLLGFTSVIFVLGDEVKKIALSRLADIRERSPGRFVKFELRKQIQTQTPEIS